MQISTANGYAAALGSSPAVVHVAKLPTAVISIEPAYNLSLGAKAPTCAVHVINNPDQFAGPRYRSGVPLCWSCLNCCWLASDF